MVNECSESGHHRLRYHFATVIVSVLYFTPVQRITSYNSGNITVYVLEDSSRKFLAEVENNGPRLTTLPRLQSRKDSTAIASRKA